MRLESVTQFVENPNYNTQKKEIPFQLNMIQMGMMECKCKCFRTH